MLKSFRVEGFAPTDDKAYDVLRETAKMLDLDLRNCEMSYDRRASRAILAEERRGRARAGPLAADAAVVAVRLPGCLWAPAFSTRSA